MNAEVVCVSSRVPTEPYYHLREFIESLRRFGEVPTVLGTEEPWRGLMTKPYLLREWLRAGHNRSDRLIVADAWDILFTQHPHGLGDRCAAIWGDAIVFNAEKGLFPRGDLEGAFRDPGTPWRYLNSGWFCGPAERILAMLHQMPIERIGFDPPGGPYPNDQGEYQALYAGEYGEPNGWGMVLDTDCRVCQTLSSCTAEEFDLSGEQVVNLVTGTRPGVFHFNGDAKNKLLPAFLERFNLR